MINGMGVEVSNIDSVLWGIYCWDGYELSGFYSLILECTIGSWRSVYETERMYDEAKTPPPHRSLSYWCWIWVQNYTISYRCAVATFAKICCSEYIKNIVDRKRRLSFLSEGKALSDQSYSNHCGPRFVTEYILLKALVFFIVETCYSSSLKRSYPFGQQDHMVRWYENMIWKYFVKKKTIWHKCPQCKGKVQLFDKENGCNFT